MQNYGPFKASFRICTTSLNISLQETILKHSAKHENIVVSILLEEATKFRVKPIKELRIIQIFLSFSLRGQMLQKKHTPLSKCVLNETGCHHNYMQLNSLLLLCTAPLQSTSPDQLPMGFQHKDAYSVNLNRIKCKLDCPSKIEMLPKKS